MSKISLSTQALTTRDWQKHSPYASFTNYDGFYLRLANKVFDYLNGPSSGLRAVFQREHLKETAQLLTRHFEDFVNEIGLWTALRRKNEVLYGRPVPFFDLDGYDPDYLNAQDFSYLLWHSLGKMAQKTLNPFGEPFLDAGEFCYELFEAKIDDAPTTGFYDKLLTFGEDVHYFDLKNRMQWLALSNYLVGPEFSRELKNTIEAQSGPKGILNRGLDPGKIIYMLTEDYVLKNRSSWCALSVPEWMAEIARCPEPLRDELRQLGKRVMGSFLYEGHDDRFYHFRFLSSWRLFHVRRDSIDLDLPNMRPGEDGAFFSIIQWRGEWWLSGTYIGSTFTPAEIDHARIAHQNASFHAWTDEQKQKIREITAEMEEVFIAYFGGRLALFPTEKAMAEALQKEQDWWNEHRTRPREPGVPPSRFNELLKSREKNFDSVQLGNPNDAAAAFFEPGVGMMMSALVPKLVHRLQAANLPKREADELFHSFFKECSPALAAELLRRCGSRNLRSPVVPDPKFVTENFLLFQHYHNPGNFGDMVPNMTLMPEG